VEQDPPENDLFSMFYSASVAMSIENRRLGKVRVEVIVLRG
jgi:hypothetical protein